MLISYIVLAISLSIDSLGIGLTYGLKNTKISTPAKIILFFISLIITTISINIGNALNNVLPESASKLFSVLLLMGIGIYIIHQAINKKEKVEINKKQGKKIYSFFIKSLGITVKIIKNPIFSDLDGSKIIDAKEAMFLGIATSIDSLCSGIGISMLGTTTFIFPFLVAMFQLIFLSIR